MGIGQGWGASVGAAVQVSPLTLVQPTLTIPVESETLRGKRGYKKTGVQYGTRTVKRQLPAVREAGGALNLEILPNVVGQLMYWWNGQESTAAVATPTSVSATPGNGGALALGAHSYRVAGVYTHSASGTQRYVFPASSSASGTASGSNLTNAIAYTAPSAITGFTLVDYAIYVKRPGASVWTFLDFVGGTSTSYSDDGSKSPNLVSQPVPGMYKHTFVVAAAAPLTNPLKYVSIVKSLDNDKAEWFAGWMADKMNLTLGNSGDAAKISFEGLALNFGTQDNVDGTPVVEDSCMNWQAHCSVAGVNTELFEGLTLNCSNGLAYTDGLRGTDFHRGIVCDDVRNIAGTLQMAHENQDQFKRLVQESSFDIQIVIDGPWSYNIVDLSTGLQVTPPPAMMIDLPQCSYTEAGGNINGPKRMIEGLPFVTADTGGLDMQIDMFTQTASYS